MKGKKTLNKTSKNNFITIGGLLLVYVIVLILKEGGITTNLINGQRYKGRLFRRRQASDYEAL